MLKIFYLKKNPGALYVTTHITHLKKLSRETKQTTLTCHKKMPMDYIAHLSDTLFIPIRYSYSHHKSMIMV